MKYSICAGSQDDRQAVQLFCRLMSLWHHREVCIVQEDTADVTVGRDSGLPPEGFRLVCQNGKATVTGNGAAGVTYGLSALLKHFPASGFGDIDLTQSPSLPFRGVHLYMPAKEGIEGFKRIIDMMAVLKLNNLIIEVGGGMEYKNHPEINRSWEIFCQNVENYPGGIIGFREAVRNHDSVHTELGGGSYLPQETVRGIVRHAKNYGIKVVPELQMLTHSYYITTAHPQLAELKDDFIPDTVCPTNEDAYKLYFELAEEIIDVFEPEMVSIGHDELMVFGQCEACSKYSPPELFAYEVSRLHAFYTGKGIEVAMWCDMLQNGVSYYTGEAYGGVEVRKRFEPFDDTSYLPATHEAIKLIPRDILLMDWQYHHCWHSQDQVLDNGFRHAFGNLQPFFTRDWARRCASPNTIGGEVSSWVLADEFTLGRNAVLTFMWYAARMLWEGAGFDEREHDNRHIAEMLHELPMMRELLIGRQLGAVSLKDAEVEVVFAASSPSAVDAALGAPTYLLPSARLPERGIWRALKDRLPEEMPGLPVGENKIIIPVGKKVKSLHFIHTCLGSCPFMPSYQMPVKEWYPVTYAMRYADGVTLLAHAQYGVDIGIISVDFGRSVFYGPSKSDEPIEVQYPDPPMYIFNHKWQHSLAYSAAPFLYGTGTAYNYEWVNPRPDAVLERVFVVNNARSKEEQAILFCVAANL